MLYFYEDNRQNELYHFFFFKEEKKIKFLKNIWTQIFC